MRQFVRDYGIPAGTCWSMAYLACVPKWPQSDCLQYAGHATIIRADNPKS